jgi:hypothetical protein
MASSRQLPVVEELDHGVPHRFGAATKIAAGATPSSGRRERRLASSGYDRLIFGSPGPACPPRCVGCPHDPDRHAAEETERRRPACHSALAPALEPPLRWGVT